MPCLNLYTNVRLEEVDTSPLFAQAAGVVADLIHKPLNYVMVVLKGSVPISFGGSEQPAAYGELISVGGIDPVKQKYQCGNSRYPFKDALRSQIPLLSIVLQLQGMVLPFAIQTDEMRVLAKRCSAGIEL